MVSYFYLSESDFRYKGLRTRAVQRDLTHWKFYPHNFTSAVQCQGHQQEERVRLIKVPGPESFSTHTEQDSFVRLRFAGFFGRGKQGGSPPTLSHVFYTTNRPFDNVGTGTQSISCQNIRALLCRMIFLALLSVNCQHVIREN